ncbi:uncharacterized protein LOC130649400 [Hydractinia symbiolongicarpus]|uniref:uncharacterized protein LOC130649400 n=1 Tax=Hydractinia symbiolongicarpus TaxID=13093 RepID=UPI00254B9729|nr:uncharacterized protein LOC130649400 [Hydractinia symbiolongicarpus]
MTMWFYFVLLISFLHSSIQQNFPAKEFFNVSEFKSGYPFRLYLCTSELINGETRCCDCDDTCMKYRTCCIDKLWTFKEVPLNEYLFGFLQESKKHKNISCAHVLSHPAHTSDTFLMVQSCLPGADGDDVANCVSPGLDINKHMPVVGSDKYLYRNKYCAKCNFVTSYKNLNIKGRCQNVSLLSVSKSMSWEILSNLTKCEFTLERNDHNLQFKACTLNPDCKRMNNNYELCKSYGGSIHSYKNYHCYKCQSKPKLITDKCISDCRKLQTCNDHKDDILIFSFTLTLKETKVKVINFRQKFPIREFMNIPLNHKFEPKKGLQQYLCSGSGDKCCDCTAYCMSRKQCCIDKLWNETHPEPLYTYLAKFLSKGKTYVDYSCEPVLPYAKLINHDTEYRLMIKTCHPSASADDQKLCQNPPNSFNSTLLPVFGSDERLYRNSYCARCNFLREFQTINVTADCGSTWPNGEDFERLYYNSTITLDLQENFRQCKFSLAKSITKTEGCDNIPKWDRDCAPRSEYYDLCSSYGGIVGKYSNYHCWRCNNEPVPDTIPPLKTCPHIRCPDCFTQLPRPWSILINFSGKSTFSLDGFGEKTVCKKNTVFDVKTSKCVTFICLKNYYPANGKCMRRKLTPTNKPNITNPDFDNCIMTQKHKLYIFLKNSSSIDTMHVASTLSKLANNSVSLKKQSEENNRLQETDVFLTQDLFKIFTNISLLKPLWKYVESLVIVKDTGGQITKLYGFDVSRMFSNSRVCAQPYVSTINNVNFSKNCDLNEHNNSYSIQNISIWITLKENNISRFYSSCNRFHLHSKCLLRRLPENITLKNGNLHVGKNTTYVVEQYMPLEDGFAVCIHTNKQIHYKWLEDLRNVEYYVSIVGTSLSILSYAWIIVTFILFKELRTLPGLNTLGMCSSLLVADIFFLLATTSNASYHLCLSVAIFLHWSLLVSFTWCTVIAFDLVSTFGSFVVMSRRSSMKKFARRYLFVLALPTLIVVITVTLDQGSNVNVGYGINHICWINYLHARIAAYIVPILLAFLVTLISLSYTIYKIHNNIQTNQNVLKSESKNALKTIKIALKLIITLGLIEGIGFIQIVKTDLSERELAVNASFGFVYSLLRSLRGVMLWLVYIFGAKAFSMYNKRIQSFRRKHAEESTHLSTKSTGLNLSNGGIHGVTVADSKH